jgi:hypothetical protein
MPCARSKRGRRIGSVAHDHVITHHVGGLAMLNAVAECQSSERGAEWHLPRRAGVYCRSLGWPLF